MSARDVIARFIAEGWARSPDSESLTADDYLSMGGAQTQADGLLKALAAAGYPPLGPDEIHAPSVERAIAANEKAREAAIYSGQIDFVLGVRVGHDRAAAALRELMKEVGRG